MTPEVRKLARELAQGSIVTDALAQFIGQVIEEIHTTKIKPLEAEAARLREKAKADVAAAYEDAARVAYDTLAAWGDYGWKCQAEGLQEAIRARAALTTEEG